jgi:hypothetical protein
MVEECWLLVITFAVAIVLIKDLILWLFRKRKKKAPESVDADREHEKTN